jgi:uncharacterized protein DUF4236
VSAMAASCDEYLGAVWIDSHGGTERVVSFRFRRSIRIVPGIRRNFGKRGVSTSIGVRGAHITVGHGKVRETVDLSGTGLSYTEVHRTHQEGRSEAQSPALQDVLPKGRAWWGWLWIAIVVAIAARVLWLLR